MNLTVRSLETFEEDFPEVNVGARKGSQKRTKDQRDWWAARRAVATLLKNQCPPPIFIRRLPEQSNPTPDFEIQYGLECKFLELTEATSQSDQQEMTASELDEFPSSLGSRGGRGTDGFAGDEPERMVAQDVFNAVQRKQQHYSSAVQSQTILGIYVNSNPGFVLGNIRDIKPNLTLLNPRLWEFAGVLVFRDSDERPLTPQGEPRV